MTETTTRENNDSPKTGDVSGPQLQVKNIEWAPEDKNIINNLSLEFEKGHVYAVVGPNGAGKSSLAYLLMGLGDYRDFKGDILFEGKSIKNLSVYERAKLGLTLGWQEPARYEGITVGTLLTRSARKTKLSKEDVKKYLEKVGLDPEEYWNRYVDKSLSGGERKRIEFASILAMKPKIAIFDEPDSGIDVEALENIFDAMRTLKKEGRTVILITHSAVVLKQTEKAFLVCNGEVVDQGPTEDIIKYFENKCIACNHKNFPKLKELSKKRSDNHE